MVKIFSGDDTDFRDDQRLALSFTAPDVDFTGCTAEVEFLGQKVFMFLKAFNKYF